MSIMYFYHIQGDIVGDIYTSLNKASQPPCCHPSDVIHGMFTYLYWPVVVLYDYSTKIRSPDYEWLQSVSNHELTQKSSRPSITNQARILRINQGTKVHNFGALQSGENFGFLKEWFPISLERLVFRGCDAPLLKGFLGVLVSAPRAQQKSGTLEIIASCSNKKDVEMVTNTVLFINMQLIAILHMYT